MDGYRQMYEAITDIWGLWKKYGNGRLNDVQWEAFLNDGQQIQKKHAAVDDQTDQFFRDMFVALRKYYERKKKDDS